MVADMLLLMLFALLVGAGTAVSPCVLPVLPALLSASASGGRRRPFGIVIGLTTTFAITIVGIAKVVGGVGLGENLLRDLAIGVLIVFGLALLVPGVKERFEGPLAVFSRLGPRTRGNGFASGLLVGGALGFVYTQARRYPEAIESLQRATQMNPSFADAYALLGGIHTYMGESAKSIPLLRTAMRLEPEGGYLYFLLLGRAYFFEGDFEQALINLRAALARNPADLEAHIYLAAALMASGNRSAAEWEAQEIRSLEPGFSLGRWLESYPLSSPPYRDSLRRPLSEILPQAP